MMSFVPDLPPDVTFRRAPQADNPDVRFDLAPLVEFPAIDVKIALHLVYPDSTVRERSKLARDTDKSVDQARRSRSRARRAN